MQNQPAVRRHGARGDILRRDKVPLSMQRVARLVDRLNPNTAPHVGGCGGAVHTRPQHGHVYLWVCMGRSRRKKSGPGWKIFSRSRNSWETIFQPRKRNPCRFPGVLQPSHGLVGVSRPRGSTVHCLCSVMETPGPRGYCAMCSFTLDVAPSVVIDGNKLGPPYLLIRRLCRRYASIPETHSGWEMLLRERKKRKKRAASDNRFDKSVWYFQ